MEGVTYSISIYIMALFYLLSQLRLMFVDKSRKPDKSSIVSQFLLIAIPISGIVLITLNITSIKYHFLLMLCIGALAITIDKLKLIR
jgi:hypothetical protein